MIRLKDSKRYPAVPHDTGADRQPDLVRRTGIADLSQPENDNVISWFASYYSNTLANYIATVHPRIQQVISQWKAQGGNASTLYSNLEKNAELKNILLQETPWVLGSRQ